MLKAVDQVRCLELLVKGATIQILFSLVPDPIVAEQDCKVDVDCPALEICYQQRDGNSCVDPCSTLTPCVANAACRVHSTTPTRTMSCVCFEGFTGNGVVSCDKISKNFFCEEMLE